MKKTLFLVGIMLFISFSVSAQQSLEEAQQAAFQQAQRAAAQQQAAQETQQDNVVLNLCFANFNFGLYVPFAYPYSTETSIEVLKFGLEFKRIGLGIEYSPFKFFQWSILGPVACSFINLSLYWDIFSVLDFQETNFLLAPFVGANYLFLSDTFDPNMYIFSAGMRLAIRANRGRIKSNIFSLDTGFRLIENQPKAFVVATLDVLTHIFTRRTR
jgi:hypothetical protein